LNDEKNIDWDTESEKALSITSAFAAKELQDHFRLLKKEIQIHTYYKKNVTNAIVLLTQKTFLSDSPDLASQINFESLGNQGFALVPYENSLYIIANTRIGLLYGAYGLLKKWDSQANLGKKLNLLMIARLTNKT